jgi:hypothetical protein
MNTKITNKIQGYITLQQNESIIQRNLFYKINCNGGHSDLKQRFTQQVNVKPRMANRTAQACLARSKVDTNLRGCCLRNKLIPHHGGPCKSGYS